MIQWQQQKNIAFCLGTINVIKYHCLQIDVGAYFLSDNKILFVGTYDDRFCVKIVMRIKNII